jgi:hypothetical protein
MCNCNKNCMNQCKNLPSNIVAYKVVTGCRCLSCIDCDCLKNLTKEERLKC